jgi:hypothetical protein
MRVRFILIFGSIKIKIFLIKIWSSDFIRAIFISNEHKFNGEFESGEKNAIKNVFRLESAFH